MKNKKLIAIIATVIAVLTAFAVAFSVSAEYSDNDPLVTLSYLKETVIPEMKKEITEAVLSALTGGEVTVPTAPQTPDKTEDPIENVDPSTVPKDIPDGMQVTPNDLSSLKYTVIFLKDGQKLMASGSNTESTEIILRAGSVRTISPFGDQGIADLTASKELYNDDPLVKNNYCLIPRGGDGRGIYAAGSDAYILVRGVYEIEE